MSLQGRYQPLVPAKLQFTMHVAVNEHQSGLSAKAPRNNPDPEAWINNHHTATLRGRRDPARAHCGAPRSAAGGAARAARFVIILIALV